MDSITLRSDLLAALEDNAAPGTESVNDLVNEAVANYLENLQRDRIRREIASYTQMQGDLAEHFLSQWVAIHNGELVDHDTDRARLYQRVRERYGRAAVLIRQVESKLNDEIRWRGGSLRRSAD